MIFRDLNGRKYADQTLIDETKPNLGVVLALDKMPEKQTIAFSERGVQVTTSPADV